MVSSVNCWRRDEGHFGISNSSLRQGVSIFCKTRRKEGPSQPQDGCKLKDRPGGVRSGLARNGGLASRLSHPVFSYIEHEFAGIRGGLELVFVGLVDASILGDEPLRNNLG